MSEQEKKELDLEETGAASEEQAPASNKTESAAPTKSTSKSAASKKSKQPDKKKGGPLRYLREMRSELKKVSWPTKKQTLNNTGIVIVVVLVVGVFVWIFDGIAGSLIGALIKLFGA